MWEAFWGETTTEKVKFAGKIHKSFHTEVQRKMEEKKPKPFFTLFQVVLKLAVLVPEL